MIGQLKGRDFLTIHAFSGQEIRWLLEEAARLKAALRARETVRPLEGKTLGMIFQKASTRTRISFEVGMWQLGGYALFLSAADLQLKRGEPVSDTARVLSRYVDGIMIRTFGHDEVEELARWADVPVINGLTDLHHPCQVMADLLTIQERKGDLAGLRLAYLGDGNNMANSLLHGCAKVGMTVAVATPPGYECDPGAVAEARRDAEATGGQVIVTHDPQEAVAGADVVYTDVWASMGQEAEAAERQRVMMPYQVNAQLMALAHKDALFLHCLPAHRGEEVTEDVLEGPQSAVWDQAENRLHAQKAILAALL